MYPLDLLVFWYHDVGFGVIDFFVKLNSYLAKLFSVGLLLQTFFKPLKNEYRKGLVLFSIVFGIFIKTFLLSLVGFFFLILIIIELFIIALFFILPGLLLYLFYVGL